MKNRVTAISELKARIVAAKTKLGLTTFKHNPTVPLDSKELNAVILLEGIDEIVKRGSRSKQGYPLNRVVELTFDIIVLKGQAGSVPIMQLCCDVRDVLLEDVQPITLPDGSKDPTTFIHELRTEGPASYAGVPNVEGIRLIIGLNYVDYGTY